MARNSNDLADSFATDESAGWLTRFLADEEELDNRAKWRLASWAAGSLGALVIAILASQTAVDRKRDQVAAADLARQSQTIQQIAKQSQNEASRLAAAIETLNSDRDRLYARLGSLEQGLDSVTGSIGRAQAPTKSSANPDKSDKPAAALPEIPVKEPATAAPPIAAVESRPPAPPSSAAPHAAVMPQPAPAPSRPALAAAAETAPAAPTSAASEPPAPAWAAAPVLALPPSPPPQDVEAKRTDKFAMAMISPATPLMPQRSILAPPDNAASKLVEPQPPAPQASARPEAEPDADTPEEAPVAVPRAAFGVDLGGANSVEGLRGLWRRLSKAHKELKDSRPIIMVKEHASGGQLRLVAGPLNDAAAAAKLCATLGAADISCETSVFDGQRLPLTTAASPQRTSRKRQPKVTTAAPEPPPPAPEPAPPPKPTPLSSILGLR